MDDEPEVIDEVSTPPQAVHRPGNVHIRGFGEGFALAIALILFAGALGIVAVSRPSVSAAPSPSAFAVGPASPSPGTSFASASPSVGPTEIPAVTPATACAATSPPDPAAPYVHSQRFRYIGALTSTKWLAAPLATSHADPPADASNVLAAPLIVSFDNGWCALAWRFLLNGVPIAQQDNPRLDPGYAAQNTWTVRLPATADPAPILRVELRFPQGWTVDEWQLVLTPQPIPDAFVATADRTDLTSPGCAFTITLSNGAASAASCATTLPTDQPPTISLDPGAQVAFRVPNAAFVADPVLPLACGRVTGQPPDFEVDSTCVLETVDDPSNALTFFAPHASGVWWVAMQGCAANNGNSACGRWYTILDTTTPGSTAPGIPH